MVSEDAIVDLSCTNKKSSLGHAKGCGALEELQKGFDESENVMKEMEASVYITPG